MADLVEPKATNRKDFIAECKAGDLDGVVACFRTFDSIDGGVDSEIVEALPKSLKFICHNGVSFYLAFQQDIALAMLWMIT